MSRHRATNVTVIHTWPDGWVKVSFDCTRACGMTGDATVGADLAAARASADAICAEHGVTVQHRVARIVGGR